MAAPVSNRLLDALSAETRKRIASRLESVPLPLRTSIYSPGVEPRYAYFITSGIASVVTEMNEGIGVEVGLLGRESLPGAMALLGSQPQATTCFMQIAGTGLRMPYRELVAEYRLNAELHTRILEQVQYEGFSLSQLSACNRLHEIEERLARWLLMVADRIDGNDLVLTQEFLAEMLGARRSSVTISAGTLQRAGLIEYRYGQVRILDRAKLESAACDCYPSLRRYQRDLYLSPPTVPGGLVRGYSG
ncbi:Crp/Fnr family transcriptional regulator [Terriglobus roseus]|uniref:cAMP-binding domain of CRP or a regulatory subunit of cAMP-dependent protein kinases n=1 Tax=Terriglobus roseus TaxID=392734 RepID=A0A1H4K0W8_9BACT|nr:Crp/Fnr family transcriptional regulator [Terriglobus roseus]SEB52077.1 cAMP-binding domain of CRP or a regulatory subunit of cAMP-dependent protein kinases [Terriglobus roseus]